MSHVNDRLRLTTATNPVDIGLVTSVSAQLNSQTTAPATGGPFDASRRITRQEPTGATTTEALWQALDLIGLTGLCFDDEDATKTHKELRYLGNRLQVCGTEGRSDDDDHLVGVAKKGLLLLSQLEFSQEQAAKLQLESHLLTNVAKDPPLAQAYDQALAAPINLTQNPNADKSFTFYGFKLLGSLLEEVTSGSIEFTYALEKPREANGTIWPGKVRIGKYRQTVRLNLSDPTIADRLVDSTGEKTTHADTELQLVQIDPDNHWVDPTDTEHIKIPIQGKAYPGTVYQGEGEQSTTSDIVIESFGSSAPLLFNTGVFLVTPPP